MKQIRFILNVSLLLFLSTGYLSPLSGQIVITTVKKADCNARNGKVKVEISNGEAPYKYNVSGNSYAGVGISSSGIFEVTDLVKGEYTIEITDKNECRGKKGFTMEEKELKLQISGGGKIPVCGKGYAILQAFASGGETPFTYSWPNGILIVTNSGGYSCTVTDKNGCTATSSTYVILTSIDCSHDPNDILGPVGFGDSRFVSINDNLQYTIHFENDPNLANSAAQKVFITLPIDKHLNAYSLTLGSFGFANQTFEIPANLNSYNTRLNLSDSLGVGVYVTAGIDVINNQAFWIFEAIDPLTGSKKDLDSDLGLLPVNDSITHRGEGFVNFAIKPKKTCHTGDSIKAMAKIIFDINDPINTPLTWNIIDALPPVSSIDSVYYDVLTSQYKLKWSGLDDAGGSGLKDYNLYSSENDAPYELYQANLGDSTFPFFGRNESSYSFYTRARDNVSNLEAEKDHAEANIYITHQQFLYTPDVNTSLCTGMILPITWRPVLGPFIDLQFSADNGNTYSLIGSHINASIGFYNWQVPHMIDGIQSCLVRVVNSNSGIHIDTSDYFTVREGIITDAGYDQSLCTGTSITLGGTPTAYNGTSPYLYTWYPAENLNSSVVSNPATSADTSISYALTVNDAGGCWGYDTIRIIVNPLPDVNISGLNESYCLNSEDQTLTGIPAGGYFTGNGIQNNTFSPHNAGIGTHEILYAYTDSNNCSGSETRNVIINDIPDVDFTGLSDRYYAKDAAATLTGTPQGGTFSGNGVSRNTFTPSEAGIGIHEITYFYTDESGCTNSRIRQVIVDNINLIDNPKYDEELCLNQFMIFPANPVENISIYVAPCQLAEGMIALYDINGKRLDIIKKGELKGEVTTYNVSRLKPGIYYILVISDNRLKYQRFIKSTYVD